MPIQNLRQYLPVFTLVALVAGLLCSVGIREEYTPSIIQADEFLQEAARGSEMNVLVTSKKLAAIADIPSQVEEAARSGVTLDAYESNLYVPDRYARQLTLNLEPEAGVWFQGKVTGGTRLLRAPDSDTAKGYVEATGTLFRTDPDRGNTDIARGITITIHIAENNQPLNIIKIDAWVTYGAFAATMFITFLLMLFVPTLAISLLKAIVDSASSTRKFKYAVKYTLATTCTAALIGSVVGYMCTKVSDTRLSQNQLSTLSLAQEDEAALYDPHPLLKQIASIVPTNPLGALSDPTGTSGLQVAFIAVVMGCVLSVLERSTRQRVSNALKKGLAVVISDRDLKWRSLSDYAELVTPAGVFFVSITVFANSDFDTLKNLTGLFLAIVVGLIVHGIVLAIWLKKYREWSVWLRDGLRPSISGLVTSFATASSYAALPAMTAVPLVASDSAKRGILNLTTTLNKNGTALYIAAAASFLVFQRTEPESVVAQILIVALVATLAAMATAGVPFAAVFGLRMVLGVTPISGGLAWVILPLDPLVDRFVTTANVGSNLVACSDSKQNPALPQSGTQDRPPDQAKADASQSRNQQDEAQTAHEERIPVGHHTG